MPGFHPDNPAEREIPSGSESYDEYVHALPAIYRDILQSFPAIEPARKAGYGLAVQTIHVALNGRYPLGKIRAACQEMEAHGVVEIRHGIFAHPTALGEELIARLTGQTAPEDAIPPFPAPPTRAAR